MDNKERMLNRAKKNKRRKRIVFAQRFFIGALLISVMGLTACAELKFPEKVVLTTGLESDEVFRIDDVSCTLPEVMVYLTNTKDQYEQTFGQEIWSVKSGEVTLQQNIKDTVLAKISQIKVMNLLARKYEVALSTDEQKLVDLAAKEYYESLTDVEKSRLDITQALIDSMYKEYALADKVYDHIIKDINPEISDDEARTITIERILIKTYRMDDTGARIAFTDEEKKEAKKTAQTVHTAAVNGTDFEELIGKYSEDSVATYSFGKGEMEENVEKVAFDLGKDEISDVVETEDGYVIIKCLSTFDKEQTEANKVKIVEQKRKEAFSKEYDAFVSSLTKLLNTDLWEKVEFIEDEQIVTTDFFKIYAKYFGEKNGSI